MARRIVFAAVALLAMIAVTPQAEAASAGFCAYGTCGGAFVNVSAAFVQAGFCSNTAAGCVANTQVLPAPLPVAPPSVGCLVNQALPLPSGSGSLVVCV